MWLPKCGNYINEGESLWWSWCKICKQVQLNIALPWFCYINVNSKLNVMETFLLSLWTLPAAQFSRVQFTFVMLFKSITYIQHAESFFKSCLRLCSNYLQSSFGLLMCKTSLCWLQGDQESLKLVAAVWFSQRLMNWRLLILVCCRTHAVSLFYKS